MRILEWYTLRIYLAALVWCLSVFLGLYFILDLLGHLDEILRYKVPFSLLLVYYGTMVPLVFVQIAPFACLMATLYTLSNLNRTREIMAMRAAGIGPWAIVRPLVWMGLLMSASVFLINETVAPQAALTTHSIKQNRLEQPADPNKPHRILERVQHLAAYGKGHTLLYARTFDPVDKKMEGVVILQHGQDLRLIRKVAAKQAVWTGSRWRFLNGTILHYNANGQTVGRPVPFQAKIIRAGDRPEILAKSESQADYMNMRDLSRYINHLQAAGGRTLRKLEVDFYSKPAVALACLVLTLIGIPFAIQPIRGGTALSLSLGLAVGLVFYATNALMTALGKGGMMPTWLAAWCTHLLFSVLGIWRTWVKLA